MKIHISNERSVAELKAQFNEDFPYLKLEVAKSNGHREKINYNKNIVKDESKIQEIRTKQYEGEIDYNEMTTVADFENQLYDVFGINVQVFRKSGKIWLETTMTDNWTLKMQNDHGREITEE
jgi:hypothetical protein